MPKIPIVVWVCPTCSHYYGSSSAGELDQKMNTEKNSNKPTFSRAICPNCHEMRVKCHFEVELIETGTTTN